MKWPITTLATFKPWIVGLSALFIYATPVYALSLNASANAELEYNNPCSGGAPKYVTLNYGVMTVKMWHVSSNDGVNSVAYALPINASLTSIGHNLHSLHISCTNIVSAQSNYGTNFNQEVSFPVSFD